MVDENKAVELNANELEAATGGGMFWNEYAKYVLKIMETGLTSSMVESTRCPYCDWKLELTKKADISSDEEAWAVEKHLITCRNCGGRSPGDAWFRLKGEQRGVLR